MFVGICYLFVLFVFHLLDPGFRFVGFYFRSVRLVLLPRTLFGLFMSILAFYVILTLHYFLSGKELHPEVPWKFSIVSSLCHFSYYRLFARFGENLTRNCVRVAQTPNIGLCSFFLWWCLEIIQFLTNILISIESWGKSSKGNLPSFVFICLFFPHTVKFSSIVERLVRFVGVHDLFYLAFVISL